MRDTVWSTGRNATIWPGTTWRYRLRPRRFDAEAYQEVTS
jgi:hypothetical protein